MVEVGRPACKQVCTPAPVRAHDRAGIRHEATQTARRAIFYDDCQVPFSIVTDMYTPCAKTCYSSVNGRTGATGSERHAHASCSFRHRARNAAGRRDAHRSWRPGNAPQKPVCSTIPAGFLVFRGPFAPRGRTGPHPADQGRLTSRCGAFSAPRCPLRKSGRFRPAPARAMRPPAARPTQGRRWRAAAASAHGCRRRRTYAAPGDTVPRSR